MTRLVALGLAILLLAAAPPPQGAAALGWMAGDWISDSETEWTEERWSDARGGMLLGTSRSGEGEKATFFEFMRIAADDEGQVSFIAQTDDGAPVAFGLTALEGQSAVFENPGHDYPTRIRYWREGEVLRAEISGPDGADEREWRFRRR